MSSAAISPVARLRPAREQRVRARLEIDRPAIASRQATIELEHEHASQIGEVAYDSTPVTGGCG